MEFGGSKIRRIGGGITSKIYGIIKFKHLQIYLNCIISKTI